MIKELLGALLFPITLILSLSPLFIVLGIALLYGYYQIGRLIYISIRKWKNWAEK